MLWCSFTKTLLRATSYSYVRLKSSDERVKFNFYFEIMFSNRSPIFYESVFNKNFTFHILKMQTKSSSVTSLTVTATNIYIFLTLLTIY